MWYENYKLIEDKNGYVVEIYLNPNDAEFSEEFFKNLRENVLDFDDEIKEFMKEKFPDVKINSVKLVLGALVVGTIPFLPHTKVSAVENVTSGQTGTVQAYSQANLNTTGVVTATKLNVRSGPSTNYSIIHLLWQGNRVKVIGEAEGFYKIMLSDGRVGWVSKSYLNLGISDSQRKINIVVSTAKSLLGTPYVWGGESPSEGGFDCSGFTQYVYKSAGYSLNRISADQANQGVYVSRTNLQPGDLLFFSLAGDGRISHVGIYIGGGRMIHSPKTGDVVKSTDITTSYWQSRFITSRRIIQ
jgi:cell wall-associated NlpC family hydrolase